MRYRPPRALITSVFSNISITQKENGFGSNTVINKAILFPSCSADLSDCQLVQVPDAVYHLMRNTELKTCDLSSNVIKKIPPKFAVKFNLITGKRDSSASFLSFHLTEIRLLRRLKYFKQSNKQIARRIGRPDPAAAARHLAQSVPDPAPRRVQNAQAAAAQGEQ